MVSYYLYNLRFRSTFISAVMWLIFAWLFLFIAQATEIYPLYFIVLISATWGTIRDVCYEGYFHPIIICFLFSLSTTLMGMSWMLPLNKEIPFFSAPIYVTDIDIFLLVKEQLILINSLYIGYLLIKGISKHKVKKNFIVIQKKSLIWLILYIIGLLSLFAIIQLSGGLGAVISDLGNRGERAAGKGFFVILHYLAYIGALVWYKNNIFKPALVRYSGLILLLFPLLLYGDRTGLLICLISGVYMDEKLNRRPAIIKILLFISVLIVLLILYQQFRSNRESIDMLLSLYKDLSMGVGYVAATQESIVDNQIRLEVLLLIIGPIIPSIIEKSIPWPISPNIILTQSIFPPNAGLIVSMGVMGEAGYILSPSLSFIHYILIGVILTWIGSIIWRRNLLFAAITAGGTLRIAKGGITAGGANILLFVLPLISLFFLSLLLKTKNRGQQNS